MTALINSPDPDGLLEYSVVYTDRSLNHMSSRFQSVMNNVSSTLKKVYNADAVAIVPGGGTFAMEAVVRQFAKNSRCLVIRNGWFSYRWSQILNKAGIADHVDVMKARMQDDSSQPPFAPPPITEVISKIESDKPDIVFAPHVETASGMILTADYIRSVGRAVMNHGGILVLDCVASGAVWVDMKTLNADVLISAPQKGWSGSPCSGLVMMSSKAENLMEELESDSFACDLKKWRQIMKAYEGGGHAYHATMPTDSLAIFNNVMSETVACGLENVKNWQWDLGKGVREVLASRGFSSVAASGWQAPGVVVSYTDDPDIKNGRKFKEMGIQIAGGVPLRCDEPENFQTFRIGLFGLDKLKNIDRTIEHFSVALDKIVKKA